MGYEIRNIRNYELPFDKLSAGEITNYELKNLLFIFNYFSEGGKWKETIL